MLWEGTALQIFRSASGYPTATWADLKAEPYIGMGSSPWSDVELDPYLREGSRTIRKRACPAIIRAKASSAFSRGTRSTIGATP
jgi:hypothetical protein